MTLHDNFVDTSCNLLVNGNMTIRGTVYITGTIHNEPIDKRLATLEENFETRLKSIEQKLKELWFAPDAPGYLEAKFEFEELQRKF